MSASRRWLAFALLLGMSAANSSWIFAQTAAPATPKETTDKPAEESPTPERPRPLPKIEGVTHVRLASKRLTSFWGRPMFVEAGVVEPPDFDVAKERLPVCYSIHGFGGSHRSAWRAADSLRKQIAEEKRPRMLYVFLNAQFPLGHHEFADSVNNGPWGSALTDEFIPALEAKYGAVGKPEGRFLTGHSSGGWSSLWLQVTYPDFFGGTWSTAPDSIDFRDFTGIDIYGFDNAYTSPEGETIPLVRDSKNGGWRMTLKEYAQGEHKKREYGGQFASFDAVFSPRGEDGRPMKLFDRETGLINRDVLPSWERYDIVLQLKRRWEELADKLAGKLHIYIGDEDTFRLEGAVKLAKAELEMLGSDAEIVIIPKRNHGTIMAPHPRWPEGLLSHIHGRMWAKWRASQEKAN